MEKLRGCKVVGLERVLDRSADIGDFILKVRAAGIRLPKVLQFRRMGYYGRGALNNSHSCIRLDLPHEHMKFVIIHEIVHNHNVRGHGKNFWRRFITLCLKVDLNPAVYFDKYCVYGRGRIYWNHRVERTVVEVV